MEQPAQTPSPPYYAVIFTSRLTAIDDGYSEMADLMVELAKMSPGHLGFETARSGLGISVSYWKDEESILNWKSNVDHQVAQRLGIDKWYADYAIRIAKVERAYGHPNPS